MSRALDSDSIYFRKALNYTKYSQKLCLENCVQDLFIRKNCNCSDASVPQVQLYGENVCYNKSKINCVRKVKCLSDLKIIENECLKYCPQECDTVEYSTTLSNSGYPSDYYSKILKMQPNFADKFNITSPYYPNVVFFCLLFLQK